MVKPGSPNPGPRLTVRHADDQQQLPPQTPRGGTAPRSPSLWSRQKNPVKRSSSRASVTKPGMRSARSSEAGTALDEVGELQAQLDAEIRRGVMTESELRLALAASQRAEEAHQQELAAVEGDVRRLLGERRGLMSKLQTIEAVEDSVRELYVQMKDRLAEGGWPTPEQLQAEKEALKGEHILVVLGSLHAMLKTLWAFKVEAEHDLQASRQARQQQHNDHVAALKAEVRELQAGIRLAHQDAAAANMRADMAEEAMAHLSAESKSVAAAMASQHAELIAALKAAQAEAEAARKAVASASEEGKRRDTLVLANRQLESARHFERVAQDAELRELQVHHDVQLAAMERELHRVSDLMSRNALLGEQLDRATAVAMQLRKAQQPSRVRDLEHQVSALRRELDDMRDRLRAALQAKVDSRVEAAMAKRPGTAPGKDASRSLAASAPGSMRDRAAQLMGAVRAAAQKEARDRAAEAAGADTRLLANVGAMQRAARQSFKEVRRELAEGGQAARARADAGLPQATASLEGTRVPVKGVQAVGAAGTNTVATPVPAWSLMPQEKALGIAKSP